MAPPINLDDPAHLDRFLALIRGASANVPEEETAEAAPESSESSHTPPDSSDSPSRDSAGSPEGGIRAPPPTPASRAAETTHHNGGHLDPVPEVNVLEIPALESRESSSATNPDRDADTATLVTTLEDHTSLLVALANRSNENLSHSKHAPSRRIPIITRAGPSSQPISTMSPYQIGMKPKPKPASANNLELLDKMKNMSTTASLQDSVVAKFREEHIPELANVVGMPQSSTMNKENVKMVKENVKMIKEEGAVSDVGKSLEDNKHIEAPHSAEPDATIPFPDFVDAADTTTVEQEEDREHATYFSSWGLVASRDAPKSRIRTVVLSNLPATTDATLIASLIHGGVIETLKIVKSASGAPATAKVTFSTGDAADKYYAKYPNGIDFRFLGKKYMAFVDKGKDVDVISGVMRGYLESGASRVVRVSGADEDWGMPALKKTAEEKGRQVEAIIDTSHGEVRIIIFRFTNIADAVQFKSQLVREVDWEGSDIHFGEDPCAKATGVHMEN